MVYRVLADGIDIFGSDTESSLLSPSLELELNSAGSLEFTLPPDHPSYDDISLMQTEIDVYEDEDLIFFGRPAEVGIDWNKQKKVVCEGALAYLNDAAIRPHKFEGALISDVFKYIIAQYNAQVAQNKQFIVGNITITDRYVYTEFDYDICLSVLISTCIDSTGGYLFLRKEENGIYIDWLDEVPDVSDQPVQFASNMLDLNQDTRAEDICTVVLPVGGQVDGVNITIASVNEGSDILEDSDAIAKYGRILKIQQWNDIIDPQALKDKATEWLEKQQEDDITIETDAAELHYLDGSVGAYRIGQLVNVISGPHGVDKEYPILKMSMSLDSGTKKITLGTPPRKELTELSGITNSTGGSSSSSGGGGGGSSDGVRDVLVNGSSVVSDHVARISAVTAQQLADGLATKADEDDFEVLQVAVAGKASQADLNALSTTVAGKASQADLNALSTTVAGKQDQLTPGTGISIDANNVISSTGGGGTEVEANPSEAATDDLNTIKIGNTVYDIPGGGSNTNYGKFKCDVLFNTPTTTSAWANPIEICTEDKTKEYNMLYVVAHTTYVGQPSTFMIMVSEIGQYADSYLLPIPRTNSNVSSQEGYVWLSFESSKLKLYTDNKTITLDKVYGLKFENKAINRSDIYSEDEQMIGRWTDGKPLYQKTIKINSSEITIGTCNLYSAYGTNSGNIIKFISGYLYRKINDNEYIDWFNSWTQHDDNTCVVSQRPSGIEFKVNNVLSNGLQHVVFTIQYTKTTDTADSGVIPEDPQMVMLSDYYSEEEQVVGRWTDGKPLYQITLNGLQMPNNDGVDVDVSHLNIDKIAFSYCNMTVNGYTIILPQGNDKYIEEIASYNFQTNNTILRLVSRYRDKSSYIASITFQYTKTTDAPGTGPTKGNLIYLPALYSEEEREVGVWTDGKPLYQKTINTGTLPNATTKTIAHGISNIETICNIFGYASNGDVTFSLPLSYNYDDINLNTRLNANNTNIYLTNNRDRTNFTKSKVTLQYTKTTDTPGSGTWTPEGQLAHHYSTSEKIVGTWIDGSTVYERTWDFGSEIIINSQTWVDIPIKMSDYNIDFCTSIVSAINNDKNCAWDFISANTDKNASQYVRLWSARSIQCPVRYLTLQYTKTS